MKCYIFSILFFFRPFAENACIHIAGVNSLTKIIIPKLHRVILYILKCTDTAGKSENVGKSLKKRNIGHIVLICGP